MHTAQYITDGEMSVCTEAVLTHPFIHMKSTFADVEPNPAIVCVVGPAAVVTFPFNSRQAAVSSAVLAPGGGFLARAPCPSYNPNPNTSVVVLIGVSLAWYFVQWDSLSFSSYDITYVQYSKC